MKLFALVTFVALSSIAAHAQVIAQASPLTLYQDIHTSLEAGKPKLAIQQFKKIIGYCKQEKMEAEIPSNYFGMALALAFSGHYQESIRYHKKAIHAHHKYRTKEDPIEMVINLGLTYELAGKNRKAKRLMSS